MLKPNKKTTISILSTRCPARSLRNHSCSVEIPLFVSPTVKLASRMINSASLIVSPLKI